MPAAEGGPPPIHAGAPPVRGVTLLTRTIPSRLDHKPALINELLAMLRDHGVTSSASAATVRLCLDEALTNSMLHGNEGDPELPLQLRLALEPTQWLLTIHDAGTGFGPQQVPAASAIGAVTDESGRGIRLLQAYLGELSYYDGGTTVLLAGARSAQSG